MVAPCAYRPGEQDGRLHLRARDRHPIVDAVQPAPAADLDRRQAVVGAHLCTHLAQRPRHALHRPSHQRCISDQLRIERLRRQQAREQPDRRAGVSHVERVRRGFQAAHADTVHPHLVGSGSSIRTPSARMAARLARQSSLARKPLMLLMPSAIPESMSERCEIDLSPGTSRAPDTRCDGAHEECAQRAHPHQSTARG